jgi:uncharacterized protein YeaO (DUF488 family)
MPIRVVRLGTPRQSGEGLRLGTVRRPPRGVRKADYARSDYYDVWLPELAPSAELLDWVKAGELSEARWRSFRRRYLAEMARAPARSILALLTPLSPHCNFSVGCYCEDESRCHRTLLRDLLTEAGAVVR